jgi:hypothetical protein
MALCCTKKARHNTPFTISAPVSPSERSTRESGRHIRNALKSRRETVPISPAAMVIAYAIDLD